MDFIKANSEIEILMYLRENGYKRIISIYPSGNKIVCWYEY